MATAVSFLAAENARLLAEPSSKGSFFGSTAQLLSAPLAPKPLPSLRQSVHASMKGKVSHPPQSSPSDPSVVLPSLSGKLLAPAVRRGTRVNARGSHIDYDYDDQESQVDIAEHKLLEPGTPGTHQAIVKSVMPVGYFLDMPSGRTAYLPSRDIGVSGGVVLLRKIFKIGQELTVRIVALGGGRDIVSIKKPEFEPPPSKYGIGKPIGYKPPPNQPSNMGTPRSRQPYPRERRY